MTRRIKIERGQVSDDGITWKDTWSVVDADAEPEERNYWGVLAYGCASVADALACAREQGWLAAGRDS